MKKMLLVAAMLAALCVPAMAGTDYNLCFSKIDSDYDGEMTKAEFKEAFSSGDLAEFKAADGDKNGTVSHEEWEDFKANKGYEEGDHQDG